MNCNYIQSNLIPENENKLSRLQTFSRHSKNEKTIKKNYTCINLFQSPVYTVIN